MTGEEDRTKTYMKNADKQDLGQWSGRHLWSPKTIRTLDRDDGQGTQTAVNTTQSVVRTHATLAILKQIKERSTDDK